MYPRFYFRCCVAEDEREAVDASVVGRVETSRQRTRSSRQEEGTCAATCDIDYLLFMFFHDTLIKVAYIGVEVYYDDWGAVSW